MFFHIDLWINQVKYGKGVKSLQAIPKLIISRKSGEIKFGNNVVFNNYQNTSWFCKCRLVVGKDATLTIGNHTGMNGVMIVCVEKITIGNNVMIGGATRIYDTNFHNLDYLGRRNHKTSSIAKTSPIIIEDDVFIGTNCIIGKGITIGARSTIAAGSVVVKSIPPDVIAGGNPCKVIKAINTDIDKNLNQKVQ